MNNMNNMRLILTDSNLSFLGIKVYEVNHIHLSQQQLGKTSCEKNLSYDQKRGNETDKMICSEASHKKEKKNKHCGVPENCEMLPRRMRRM